MTTQTQVRSTEEALKLALDWCYCLEDGLSDEGVLWHVRVRTLLTDLVPAIKEALMSVSDGAQPSVSVEQDNEVLGFNGWGFHIEKMSQSDQYKQVYKKGYADAMNWKVQNYLEHWPTAPLDMFKVEELAKQCGLEWSTKIQNLCDMVAMSVDTDDISSERVDKEDENVHEPVAWLCKRKDGHFDVLTDQTCKKCFPVYTHPQKLGMTDEDFKNDRYA